MDLSGSLHAHLSRFETAPFLFVGSGMSRRYLGTEDWESLLRHFAGYTDQPYERYRADAAGDLPSVASVIAENFRVRWWEDDEFAESRALYPEPGDRYSPLKIEVARRMKDAVAKIPQGGPLHTELELMKKSVIEGVITTNYDLLLNKVFSDFTVYAGQDKLLFSNPQGVGEIYMIHGSADDPETIVLTSDDYDHFKARNEYLAAKLLTIFVEHPVVFLGYSLSDKNIQEIIRNIAKILTPENLHKLQDRLIFVQWSDAATSSTLNRTFMAFEGLQIPIMSVEVRDFMDIFTALGSLKRRLPPKILRQVKEQVYELVSTSKTKGTLLVRDIADDVDPSTVEIVIGVGIRQTLALNGLVGWSRMDLLKEVLNRDLVGNEEAMETLCTSVLQNHLMGGTNAPVFYYLRHANRLNESNNLSLADGLHERVISRATNGYSSLTARDSVSRSNQSLANSYSSFADLALLEDPHLVLTILPAFDVNKIDLEDMREFLRENVELTPQGKPATLWAKAVCLYDLIAHGPSGG